MKGRYKGGEARFRNGWYYTIYELRFKYRKYVFSIIASLKLFLEILKFENNLYSITALFSI